MVYFYRPFFVLSFLTFFSTAKASFVFDEDIEKIHLHLFELKTKTAKKELQLLLTKNPNNGLAIYLENYTELIECLILGQQDNYLAFKTNTETRLQKLNSVKPECAYKQFVISEMKLQLAFGKLYFQERVSGFWSLRQAYKIAKENSNTHPNFEPSKKTLGLLEVLIGSVPEEHKWIVNSVGLSGNQKNGLKMLDDVANGKSPFRKEAKLLRLLTQFYILQTEPLERLKEIDVLYQSDRENLLTAFIYASMLYKQGRNDETISVLTRLPDGEEYIDFYYLTTMLGDCYLYKAEYKMALTNYLYFLNHYKGIHYLKATHFKTSLAYWLQNDLNKAEKHRISTIEKGVEYFESDKRAMKYAKQNIHINSILLQAQLYHDGGYYNQALELLNKHDVSTFDSNAEKLEYFYRKGRIYQKIGFTDKAIRHYVSAINISKDGEKFYFAPNACLQLGYIFRDLGDNQKAIYYFNKAMHYSGHEYKSSIDSQAKSALTDLEKK